MKKIRIVMADDHDVVRLGISALLSTVGDFDVVGQASDGEEAVAAVKHEGIPPHPPGVHRPAAISKLVFVQPLRADARSLLSQAVLPLPYQIGGAQIVLTAAQMQSLPTFFREIPDPRRAQGRRHGLSTVLAIAAGAVLRHARLPGHRRLGAIWAQGTRALRLSSPTRPLPCPQRVDHSNVLIRVAPAHLDCALRRWNEAYAGEDESLAIDGKTMCNALDEQGHPTHVMSVVGHQTHTCYTQKKSVPCR